MLKCVVQASLILAIFSTCTQQPLEVENKRVLVGELADVNRAQLGLSSPGSASKSKDCQNIAIKSSFLKLLDDSLEFESLTQRVNAKLKERWNTSLSSELRRHAEPLVGKNQSQLNLKQTERSTLLVDFKFKDIPLCLSNLLVAENGPDLRFVGQIPAFSQLPKDILDTLVLPTWPNLEESTVHIVDFAKQRKPFRFQDQKNFEVKVVDASKCLKLNSNDTLDAYWKVNLDINGVSLSGTANRDGLLQGRYGPQFAIDHFDASGEGAVISRSFESDLSYSFKTSKVKFTDLGEGGYLCNPRISTDYAFHEDRDFSFLDDKSENQLSQVTMFNNLEQHAQWFMSLSAALGRWAGPQVRIAWSDSYPGATYKPSGDLDWDGPMIIAGNGDGFRNISRDPEVVSHELGHHVLYRTMRQAQTVARSLHEGLADYFVYARLGNPKLAETVCTEELVLAEICEKLSFMRTAENDLKFSENTDLEFPHDAGRIISGMLWDVGLEIGQEETASIVFQGIEYLTGESDFVDFFMALFEADLDLNDGANACLIFKKGEERGFATLIQDIDCKDYVK